mmetsp:Transcript_9583/g.21367  ORF Transcript_9583/g.21367 Transcript_9583/m.21367 type:complete len:377 (+) Transcript_9583:93-1223(+)
MNEVRREDRRCAAGPLVEVIAADEDLPRCEAAFNGQGVLALDVEGVDLGREGQTCLVQLATPKVVFLFDVLHQPPSSAVVLFLKGLLENDDIVKIIHDCKMDSEVLHLHLDIELRNVHDTQAWHHVMEPQKRKKSNLNDTLKLYGCGTNLARDSSIYKNNPAFWASRPITEQMIRWASEDVATLFALHEAQLLRCRDLAVDEVACKRASDENLRVLRDATFYERIAIHPSQLRLVVGFQGENVSSLEDVTGAHLSVQEARGERSAGVVVRALSAEVLASAREELQRYCQPAVEATFDVKPKQAGKLLGRGGSNIQRLRASTGSHLHFNDAVNRDVEGTLSVLSLDAASFRETYNSLKPWLSSATSPARLRAALASA